MQQSLNCKLKNKKSIITVPGCSWLEAANSLQNMIIFIGGIYNTAMTQSFYAWFTDFVIVCLLTCEVETMV